MTYETEMARYLSKYSKCMQDGLRQLPVSRGYDHVCKQELVKMANAIAKAHGNPKPYKTSWFC